MLKVSEALENVKRLNQESMIVVGEIAGQGNGSTRSTLHALSEHLALDIILHHKSMEDVSQQLEDLCVPCALLTISAQIKLVQGVRNVQEQLFHLVLEYCLVLLSFFH